MYTVGQGSGERLPFEVFYPASPGAAVERETHYFVFSPRLARNAPVVDDKRRPLVLLSHGHSGTIYDLYWLAEPLVRAGFIVAALEHPKNHLFDIDWVASLHVWRRPQDVSSVLTTLLDDRDWNSHIDSTTVAAAGHSVGGYTVLSLGGARYSIHDARRICRTETPEDPTCLAVKGRDFTKINYTDSAKSYRDVRIGHIFSFSPAVGEALWDEPVAGGSQAAQVRIYTGDADQIAPHHSHAQRWGVRLGFPVKIIEGGDHYAFITPCNWFGRVYGASACFDPDGFDRRPHQRKIAKEVIAALGGPVP